MSADRLFDVDYGLASHQRPGSLSEAKRDRDVALRAVEENSDGEWRAEALEAVYRTAERLETFISDDVWASGLSSTREERALGPVLRKAAALGWIVKSDRVRPSRKSHLAGKPVWFSHLWRNA